jgi:hypothetical protein
MARVLHTVRLTSREQFGRKAPPSAVGEILRVLPVAVKQSVRMGFTGRSTTNGRSPAWLAAAADIRLVDFGGDQDTILSFEAPTFDEVAEELYRQPTLWPVTPSPADTGFDVFGDVLADVNSEAKESDRFDRPLLRRLAQFRAGLEGGFDSLLLVGHRLPEASPAILTAATIAAARRLDLETPSPQRVRVAGRLDMIWQSRQGYILTLDDGQEVRGVLVEGDMSSLANLFNQRVVVHGRAVYRPSGHLLRLDAERIDPGPDERTIWSHIPPAKARKPDTKRLMQMQTQKSGVADLFGKWPGDETDEQILDMLKRMG